MVQTAIISFILIGMMFFLMDSGEKEEKTEHKVETSKSVVVEDENSSEKHQFVDEVQVKKEETHLKKIVIHKPLKINRDMNYTKKSIVELNHIEDVELTTHYPKPKEKIEKSVDKPKVVEDVNTTKPTLVKEKSEKIEEPVKATEVVMPKAIEVKSDTEISDDSIKDKPVALETNVTLPTVSKIQNVKITIPKVPKVKSLEEFESNSKMLKLYHKEQQLKEEAQSEVNLLNKKLTVELEKESALNAQLEKVNRLAKQGELQARAYEESKKREIATLVSEKEELKSNLITHIQHEKELELKRLELKQRMANMLDIAKEGTKQADEEFNKLKAQKEALEQNLTLHIKSEDALTLKLKEESKKESLLEKKLVEHLNKEGDLKERITKMLIIAKDATQKGEAELKAKESKIASLLSTQKSLEENLTKEDSELAKLKEENLKLQTEIKQLKKVEEVKAQELQKEIKKNLTKAFSLSHVEFKINSSELTNESKKRLDEVAKVINEHKGYRYKIQGHTDNIGNEEFNIKLSKDRAESVKYYLVSKGVDETILSSEGLGSSQLITSNDTKEGREKNRRVVFEIIK